MHVHWLELPLDLNRSRESLPRSMADGVINNRRVKRDDEVPDLLDLLLAGEDPETKRKMNTDELRDNLLTFIVAGHETTALTLSWALYLCAFDQDVQDRARAEAQSVLDGRVATQEDLANLPADGRTVRVMVPFSTWLNWPMEREAVQ